MKSTNSNRSSSVQSVLAWRMNTAVSATVIGRVGISRNVRHWRLFFKSAQRGCRLLVHDPCPPRRRGDRLGPVRDGADHPRRERPLRRRAHPQCRRTTTLAGPPPFPPPQAGEGWGGGGPMGPPTLFTITALRYMKTYDLTHEQLAMVSVVQREWAAKKPRATFKTPITRRGCAQFADDRLPVPLVAVLPGFRRARPRLPAKLALAVNRSHRRESYGCGGSGILDSGIS